MTDPIEAMAIAIEMADRTRAPDGFADRFEHDDISDWNVWLATAAYNAMRAKLVPVGWLWSHRKFGTRVSECPLTEEYLAYGGWTSKHPSTHSRKSTMVKVTDADEWRITDADIEAIADDDPVWKVAERVVYENHGVGNAAVIIRRYYIAGVKAALEAAADILEARTRQNWLHAPDWQVAAIAAAIRNIDPEECE